MSVKNRDLIGNKTQAVPKPQKEIGIDTTGTFIENILDGILVDAVDIGGLNAFSNQAQTREQIYKTIDAMALDDRVSSILETYTEDCVETNDSGQVVWCESSDENVNKYVTFLLDSLNVDKNIYEWVYSFIKYGDLYLKLYHESDYGEDILFKDALDKKNKTLNEDIYVNAYEENDRYVPYVKRVNNPGEMFELTRFGKTSGYIQAPVTSQATYSQDSLYSYLTYKMKKTDVNIYGATEYVHASLINSNASRFPEEITIFKDDDSFNSNSNGSTYEVKKGQSLLFDAFRIWRQLSLLENSVMLNRIVSSAIVRVINVEIGNMPKDKVSEYMNRLKMMIEQKSALSVDNQIQEYNSPGPIVNTVYVPTHEGQGNLTMNTIGGDFDPKSLTDLDYFLNKFYGSFRVPKQYFGNTDDAAGFNGGSSLAILSSRYGKAIKSIQNLICQMLTDLVNIFLVDRGLDSYINKFRIRMQAPVTQEELDRRDNLRNRMGVVQDIMNQISSVVDDKVIQLKVLKTLLSSTLTDPEVITLLQEQIDKLEKEINSEEKDSKKKDKDTSSTPLEEPPFLSSPRQEEEPLDLGNEEPEVEEPTEEPEVSPEETIQPTEDSFIPSPNDLEMDFTSNL